MYLIVPEEIRKLERIFKPYMDGCHLREDAPQEAVEALKKHDAWYIENQGLDQ